MPTLSSATLTHRLQRTLHSARAEASYLPDVPEIQLYLLNRDFCNATITPEERLAVIDHPAYWAFCWGSGQALARFLLDQPDWVRGKHVMDFGSGSGVAAIAAAKAGAARVTACDIDPDALLATRLNAHLNEVEVQLTADFDQTDGPIDMILAADVLYDQRNFDWLDRLLARAPTVLLADSRIKDFKAPGYLPIAQQLSSTYPDLNEVDYFRWVTIYRGRK